MGLEFTHSIGRELGDEPACGRPYMHLLLISKRTAASWTEEWLEEVILHRCVGNIVVSFSRIILVFP